MHPEKRMRNIWYFVGWILFFIGLVELAAGIANVYFPSEKNVKLAYFHANIWWGILIMLFGSIFLWKNWRKYIDL